MTDVLRILADQRDFGLFLWLLFCALCALECIVLYREKDSGRRWLAFFAFFLFQALAVLWTLVSPLLEAGPPFAVLPTFLRSLAYGSLFAFSPSSAASRQRKQAMLVVSVGLIAGCAVGGQLFGVGAYSLLVHSLLGVAGAAFAVKLIRADQAKGNPASPWLTAYAVTFVVAVLSWVGESVAGMFAPARLHDLYLLSHVVLSIVLSFTLTVHAWRSFTLANRGLGRGMMRISIYGAFFGVPAVIILGAMLTSELGSRSLKQLRSEYSHDSELLRTTLQLQTRSANRDVSIMAQSQRIIDFLAQPGAATSAQADALLDMYTTNTPGSTFYLLDAEGTALASSNRSLADSFVGRDLPEIPASVSIPNESASAEKQWRFFASGSITGERGYYAASTVYDAHGRGLGLAVGKLDLKSMLAQYSFLAQFSFVSDGFLVNSLGVVFLADRPEYLYRTLWPITGSLRNLVAVSSGPVHLDFDPLITAEPVDGAIVPWRGLPALVTRTLLEVPGWSIIQFGSLYERALSRMAGILATLIAALVIAGYAVAAQLTLLSQARIERSEMLYRTLIEGAPDWISIVDDSGSFIFTNKAGQDSIGLGNAAWTREQVERLLGAKVSSEIAERVEESAEAGIVTSETRILVESCGERAWRLTFVPLETEGPAATAILIGRDVTDIRRAEASLVRAERTAAVGTLAAGIAHQFNNINAVALGYLQIIEMERELPEAAARYASLVRTALERSVDLTTRLLPLSIPYGTQQSTVNLVDILHGAIRTVQPDLDKERVRIEFTQCEPAVVHVNPEQMGFVAHGLLVNAWHAVLGKADRSIRLGTGTSGAMAFLRVQDTGSGVAPEKMSSLFTPFFSEKGEHAPPESPQSRVRGVGLSLAVSHAIIAGQGGRIDVQSVPGEGTTFTVWLPEAMAGA